MSKLFLLSVEEANKIHYNILACENEWWWLRSPGITTYKAANVDFIGRVYEYGNDVFGGIGGVRPAIRLTSDTSNLKYTKKGYIKFGHRLNCNNLNYKPIKWIDISEYMGRPCLLMKKPYEYHRFDSKSNIYEKSEIFEYLKKLDDEFFTDEEKAMIEDWEV